MNAAVGAPLERGAEPSAGLERDEGHAGQRDADARDVPGREADAVDRAQPQQRDAHWAAGGGAWLA